MATATGNRALQIAESQDRDLAVLRRIGVREAGKIGLAIRRATAGAFRDQDSWTQAMHREFEALRELLRDGMMAAHLKGRRRVQLIVARWRKERSRVEAAVYDEALGVLQERLQMTGAQRAHLTELYGRHAVDVVQNAEGVVQRQVNEAIETATREGMHVREGATEIRKAFDQAGITPRNSYLAETLFRTQTQMAYAAGRANADRDPIVDEILWGYEYVTVGDDRVRPSHAGMDGMRLEKTDARWSSMRPPNGYNSFVPGTMVAGEFVSASKAFYSGPIVEIETANGSRLAVTINHPVLTPFGFVPAGQIREGNYLVQYSPAFEVFMERSGDRGFTLPPSSGRTVNDQDMPSGIQDVFDTFLSASTLSRGVKARCGPLDFHGDARFYQGDVHIVTTDGLLPNDLNALSAKLGNEVSFVKGLRAATFFNHRFGMPMSTDIVRFGPTPDLDASLFQSRSDDVARAAESLRQLQYRNAGQVRFDKVVRRNVMSWSGHVYDLQSPNGTIVANGLVVSNCRCQLVAIFKGDEEAKSREPPPEVTDEDGHVVRVGPDTGFAFDPATIFSDTIPA